MRHKKLYTAIAGLAAATLVASTATATGTVMYDAVPDPLPSNVASLGYAATSTSEFGQALTAATTGPLDAVIVTMSSFACQSGNWNLLDCETERDAYGSLPTFDHPITINLYEPGGTEVGDTAGPLIGSVTQMIAVPYRPSYDTDKCTDGGYFAADFDRCTQGYAFNATFDFTDEGITLPDEFVVGVAYNTQSYGADPIGVGGPYDSLNVGIDLDPSTEPTVGTPGDNYWDATYLGRAPGFRSVGNWDYDIMIRFETAPSAPMTADDCKKGGFAQYGFKNQGQCVASVKANEKAGK